MTRPAPLLLAFLALTAAATGAPQDEGPAAKVAVRNVLGINEHTLVDATLPRLGSTWSVTLNCQANQPGLAYVAARSAPLYGVTTRAGEVLIDLFSGRRIFSLTRPHGGGSVRFDVPVPRDVALLGFEAHVQGLCTGGPGPRLSNALVLTLGR